MMLGPAAGNTAGPATRRAKTARQELAAAPADWRQQIPREYRTAASANQRLKEPGQPSPRD